ncbi:hypothetical protein [Apibacter sp. HY039]|uniref:hypothetical protein n=1 Tax=Apibacter sp. HY039 TaxID=2501476 RepID=UPI000FEB6C09|nr:hypothetical protein [Apibacter sp. HY039]
MRNSILVVLILFLTSCKTTPEEYSSYPFIDQGIQSEKYEINIIFPENLELTTLFGERYPPDPRSFHAEEINQMPLVVYDKLNTLFFKYIDNNKNYMVYNLKYNTINYKLDTLNNENMTVICDSYAKKENKFVNFKFPEEEKYYKFINKEYHSEISEEEKKKVLEEYKDSREEIKKDIIETRSLRYNTMYVELEMPQEKIHFKFNSDLNKQIEFFGNRELYKKGYIYVYIYNKLSMFPHSGGLYVIRPKEKK